MSRGVFIEANVKQWQSWFSNRTEQNAQIKQLAWPMAERQIGNESRV